MAAKEAWGLDIGHTAIRMVKMQRQKTGVVVTDLIVHDLGWSPDEDEREFKVQEALEEIIASKRIGKKPVVVSQAGANPLFRDFPLPAISTSRLHEIVSYEARQQIPYPLEEVLWDFHHYRPEEDSPELNIALVCVRRDFVEQFLDLNEELGLNVVGIMPAPVALANFIQYDQPPEGTAVVLDAGVQSTDFLVLRNGSFWLRSIPVCGTDLTKALMSKFNMGYPEAEELKAKMAESKQADRVFQVVKPALRSLAGEVQRSLGYYKSLYRGTSIDCAICAGGSFLLDGVDQFMADDLGLPVSLVQDPTMIGLSSSVDEDEFNAHLQSLGVAMGLALSAIGEGEVEINLLPPEVQQQHMIQAKVPMALASVGLLTATTVVSLLCSMGRSEQWVDLNDRLDRVNRQVETSIGGLKEIEDQYAPQIERNESLAKLAVTRGTMSSVTSLVLETVDRVNRERRQAAESEIAESRTKYFENFFNSDETQQKLEQYEENLRNDLEKLKDVKETVRKACENQALRRTDRLRRIFIENLTVEPQYVYWFREKATEEMSEEERKNCVLLSPEEADFLNKKRQNSGEEGEAAPLNLETVPVRVVRVSLKGFAVGSKQQFSDVTRLRPIFEKISGVRNVAVRIDTNRTTNTVPLPKITYPRVEREEAAIGSTTAEAEKVVWEDIQESINGFTLDLLYMPDADRKGATPAQKQELLGKKALEKYAALEGVRLESESKKESSSSGSKRGRGRRGRRR